MAASAKRHLRVHAPSVVELLGISAMPALFSLWVWRGWVQGLTQPVNGLAPAALVEPSLAAALIVSEFLFVLAFLFGVLPVQWWVQSQATHGQKMPTPLRRMARTARHTMHAVTAEAPPDVALEAQQEAGARQADGSAQLPAEPGDLAAASAQGAPGQPANIASATGEGGGQAATAGATQPAAPGTTVPVAAAAQPGTTQAATPAAATPGQTPGQPAMQPSAPGVEEGAEEEETDLASLTDVSSVLNDAFGDNDILDPLLQAMSEHLPDVDMRALLTLSRHIHKEIVGGMQPSRRAPLPPKRRVAPHEAPAYTGVGRGG